MVFTVSRITRVVIVEPQYLGRGLMTHVRKQCAFEVVGRSLPDAGLVVAIIDIDDRDIGKGVIDDLLGSVRFTVAFDAICFRVLKNEVIDGEVERCWSSGLLVAVGPGLTVYVDVGVLPSDMHFVASGEGDYWATEGDAGYAIKKGAHVRVRIINPSKGDRAVAAVATMTDPGLGVLA
jgi:DNA-directed RNA polymerase subunit E'/Rpb7